MANIVQTSAHDYFADCAENYVAYLFSHAGFEVYGSGKWAADVVIRDKTGRYWRIEVRSTDRDRSPKKKNADKLVGKAELYSEVRLIGCEIQHKIWKLNPKGVKYGVGLVNPTSEALRQLTAE